MMAESDWLALVLVAEAHHGDRQLGGADAGDLDPELGRRRQRASASSGAQARRREK